MAVSFTGGGSPGLVDSIVIDSPWPGYVTDDTQFVRRMLDLDEAMTVNEYDRLHGLDETKEDRRRENVIRNYHILNREKKMEQMK